MRREAYEVFIRGHGRTLMDGCICVRLVCGIIHEPTFEMPALLQSKPNQKLFLKHEKDVVDQCFREQAMQEYALENNRLKQALAGVRKQILVASLPH